MYFKERCFHFEIEIFEFLFEILVEIIKMDDQFFFNYSILEKVFYLNIIVLKKSIIKFYLD